MSRLYPLKLPFCTFSKLERAPWAKDAFDLGINYLGVCCGANPMLIREVAEAVGLKVPSSRYRENMENHYMFGKNKRIPKHIKDYRSNAWGLSRLFQEILKII